jgi:hypothetical protein
MPRHFLPPALGSMLRTAGLAVALVSGAAWSAGALAREPASAASSQGVEAPAGTVTVAPVLRYGTGYERRLRAAARTAVDSTRLSPDKASGSSEPGNPSANRGGRGGGQGGNGRSR